MNVKNFARIALYALALVALAIHLPELYDRVAFQRVNKTHIFYSPVSKRFIYTESLTTRDPQAAAKAEDHHSDIVYKDQDGVYYDRLAFERLLPFIYYRNMEVRGYMPLVIDGQTFDAETVRAERQVMELSARELDGRHPPEDVWPLFEAQPGQAALAFPDDRCRFTDDELEFVNADYNRVDPDLTAKYTAALLDAGFTFPARHVAGKFTILKLFDDGVFVVDANEKLFNLMRLHGEPRVESIDLPDGVSPRHIQVSENKFYRGLLLDRAGKIYLLNRGGSGGISLIPAEGYDAERMDFKILFNPLYRTASYSDETTVRAVAMDLDLTPIATYEHAMSRGAVTWKHKLRDAIFPFRVTLRSPETEMVDVGVRFGSYFSTLSVLVGLVLFCIYQLIRRLSFGSGQFWAMLVLFALTGVYGAIAASFIEE